MPLGAAMDNPLQELGLSKKEIMEIVEATGKQNDYDYGFTFSDLTQRLIPSIILDAYPDNKVAASRAVEIAKSIVPTSPFKEN